MSAELISIHPAAQFPHSDELLQKFWIIEEVFYVLCPCLSPEEKITLTHFNTTCKYLSTARLGLHSPEDLMLPSPPPPPPHPPSPLGESRKRLRSHRS